MLRRITLKEFKMMENILEWAAKIDKNALNKPNRQLQEELFRRVVTALQENTNDYRECAAVFFRFDAKVIVPFYQEIYWTDVPDRTKWDEAFLDWANSRKPTVPATIRMALILQEKLKRICSSSEALPEIRWFSLHEDKRSASAFKGLREKSAPSDLKKLLDLDMRDWKTGKPLIAKMYGVLFSGSTDAETSALYGEFLARNGLDAAENRPAADPLQAASSLVDTPNDEKDMAAGASSAESDPGASMPTAGEQSFAAPSPARTETAAEAAFSKPSEMPRDGVALAEAMLMWARGQKDRLMALGTQLSDSMAEAARLARQNGEMKMRIAALEASLTNEEKTKQALEGQLREAKETIAALEAEKNGALDSMEHLHVMFDDSVKQQLDGLKYELTSELSKTAKDFASDVSDLTDAEKVEVYTALMEELFDVLKHKGILIEGN